jgi:hypothetical protein
LAVAAEVGQVEPAVLAAAVHRAPEFQLQVQQALLVLTV